MDSIVIVGGGTSGWMSATTLIKFFPDKKITLVESPDIPTVGVGESTLGFIKYWCAWVGINEVDFMPHCDATHKFSIRFEDFYRKSSGSFHYPFGSPFTKGNYSGFNDWHFMRLYNSENTPISDYADSFYPIMAFVNQNKIPSNDDLEGLNFCTDTGYQFDATKFGLWLKDNCCISKGINHILSEVKDVVQGDSGIESLVLGDGRKLNGDLFIDCTGFKSLLLGGALKEPFESFEDVLPNNSAWATKIPYRDKESEMSLYTNCCAIDNGWVWNIPLWSRIGSGYVYSDNHISDEGALDQFRSHLIGKGHEGDLEYKNIKMRTGMHNRFWVKNVCAIGLSAGFIEPLESGGLFTTHEFLLALVRILDRGYTSRWDKDVFNFICRDKFREFKEFVALHYALSHRDDTEYWKDNLNRDYSEKFSNDALLPSIQGFTSAAHQLFREHKFRQDNGFHCIATGMHWFPTDMHSLNYDNCVQNYDIEGKFLPSFFLMEKRKEEWNRLASGGINHYEFLKGKYENT